MFGPTVHVGPLGSRGNALYCGAVRRVPSPAAKNLAVRITYCRRRDVRGWTGREDDATALATDICLLPSDATEPPASVGGNTKAIASHSTSASVRNSTVPPGGMNARSPVPYRTRQRELEGPSMGGGEKTGAPCSSSHSWVAVMSCNAPLPLWSGGARSRRPYSEQHSYCTYLTRPSCTAARRWGVRCSRRSLSPATARRPG